MDDRAGEKDTVSRKLPDEVAFVKTEDGVGEDSGTDNDVAVVQNGRGGEVSVVRVGIAPRGFPGGDVKRRKYVVLTAEIENVVLNQKFGYDGAVIRPGIFEAIFPEELFVGERYGKDVTFPIAEVHNVVSDCWRGTDRAARLGRKLENRQTGRQIYTINISPVITEVDDVIGDHGRRAVIVGEVHRCNRAVRFGDELPFFTTGCAIECVEGITTFKNDKVVLDGGAA